VPWFKPSTSRIAELPLHQTVWYIIIIIIIIIITNIPHNFQENVGKYQKLLPPPNTLQTKAHGFPLV
jgi:hypothetical protein